MNSKIEHYSSRLPYKTLSLSYHMIHMVRMTWVIWQEFIKFQFNSCAFSCHSSDKRLYFADNTGYEHDSIKQPPETPPKISRRNFWCNKIFLKKKFQIEISPEVHQKNQKFSIVGHYFDPIKSFLNWIRQKVTLVSFYQIFVTPVTKESATAIRKNESATVKKQLAKTNR